MLPIPYTRFILIPLLINISLTTTVAYSYFHLWGLGGVRGDVFTSARFLFQPTKF